MGERAGILPGCSSEMENKWYEIDEDIYFKIISDHLSQTVNNHFNLPPNSVCCEPHKTNNEMTGTPHEENLPRNYINISSEEEHIVDEKHGSEENYLKQSCNDCDKERLNNTDHLLYNVCNADILNSESLQDHCMHVEVVQSPCNDYGKISMPCNSNGKVCPSIHLNNGECVTFTDRSTNDEVEPVLCTSCVVDGEGEVQKKFRENTHFFNRVQHQRVAAVLQKPVTFKGGSDVIEDNLKRTSAGTVKNPSTTESNQVLNESVHMGSTSSVTNFSIYKGSSKNEDPVMKDPMMRQTKYQWLIVDDEISVKFSVNMPDEGKPLLLDSSVSELDMGDNSIMSEIREEHSMIHDEVTEKIETDEVSQMRRLKSAKKTGMKEVSYETNFCVTSIVSPVKSKVTEATNISRLHSSTPVHVNSLFYSDNFQSNDVLHSFDDLGETRLGNYASSIDCNQVKEVNNFQSSTYIEAFDFEIGKTCFQDNEATTPSEIESSFTESNNKQVCEVGQAIHGVDNLELGSFLDFEQSETSSRNLGDIFHEIKTENLGHREVAQSSEVCSNSEIQMFVSVKNERSDCSDVIEIESERIDSLYLVGNMADQIKSDSELRSSSSVDIIYGRDVIEIDQENGFNRINANIKKERLSQVWPQLQSQSDTGWETLPNVASHDSNEGLLCHPLIVNIKQEMHATSVERSRDNGCVTFPGVMGNALVKKESTGIRPSGAFVNSEGNLLLGSGRKYVLDVEDSEIIKGVVSCSQTVCERVGENVGKGSLAKPSVLSVTGGSVCDGIECTLSKLADKDDCRVDNDGDGVTNTSGDDDDDDVVIVEMPFEEPVCITIDDSCCFSTEYHTDSESENETGKPGFITCTVQDIQPDLQSVFKPESCEPSCIEESLDIEIMEQSGAQPHQQGQGGNRRRQNQHNAASPGQASGHKGRGKAPKQKQQQNNTFEPYWSSEAVSEGIKRGELIVAPLRINPKNYEDAYIPLPDGKSDLFIGGMKDRNRAFNTDVVVVQPYPKENWRVFMEEIELYEETHRAGQNAVTEKADDAADDNSDEDSGPDVIYDTDSDNEVDAAISHVNSKPQTETSEAAGEAQSSLEKAVSAVDISDDGQADNGASVPIDDLKAKVNKIASRINEKLNKRQQQTPPASRKKKFSSVSEMAQSGSPLARSMFQGDLWHKKEQESGRQFVQQTGKVVYIYEQKHSRAASGRLKLMPDRNKNWAMFSPSDSRIPRLHIPMAECPKGFYERPEDFASTLYIARIRSWSEHMKLPCGTLARSIGEAGQIEPETEAMLIEMDIDDTPFSSEVEACLPKKLPWTIPESEFSYRKDLRSSCIFTIDPATARDLDDAMSIEDIGGGKYEIGVHIADVSFFVKEGTALDEVALKRATSVYLVQKVVPMLPRLLCEELCSLNPDQDRLAFSVMWTINEEGEIFTEWYGRTVIRSCVKLSYDHAQGFIEEPDRNWTREELPPITNSFEVKDIMQRVLKLNKIAVGLRKQRFENGALRLDQVKLQYALDHETGLPNGYSVYQQKDSNRLIEEFMLLANMAVAHKLRSSFPDKAVLRRHPPPQVKPLQAVEDLCETLNMDLNVSSAGSLQKSLWKYFGTDEFSQARLQVLIVLVSKPMQNAKYFCAGTLPDETLYHHYALNVPLYTHFTSPIRRYPDIMVHRLLAASLGYHDPTELPPKILQLQADSCNDKKLNAKMASDRSSEMYFSIFVKEAGPLEETGMVMAVLDKSFDVLILKLGVVKRVYLERLPLRSHKFRKSHRNPVLEIEWQADEKCDHRTRHRIGLFSVVDCYVFAEKEPLRWSCVIRRPKEEIRFQTEEGIEDA